MESNKGASSINNNILVELVNTSMPYGKYTGRLLCDCPSLIWYGSGRRFSEGKLGQQLSAMYEIKVNGLEYLLRPLKNL